MPAGELENWVRVPGTIALASRFDPATMLDGLAASPQNVTITLDGFVLGDSDGEELATWNLAKHRIVAGPRSKMIRVSVNKRTGWAKGTYLVPGTSTKVLLNGVVFQKQDLVFGEYSGRDVEPGALFIEPR